MTTQEYERREFARVAEAMEAPNAVFVFGSNLTGRHGAGAAKTARERYGAVQGVGYGMRGRSFAIPTKDERLRTLPLPEVEDYVGRFVDYAWSIPTYSYVVTRVGTGLAGFSDREIAPLFKDAPENVLLPIGWREINGEEEAG
jgi:hypothetical protein